MDGSTELVQVCAVEGMHYSVIRVMDSIRRKIQQEIQSLLGAGHHGLLHKHAASHNVRESTSLDDYLRT